MASGDNIEIDFTTAKAENFLVRVSGINGDIPVKNFTANQATNRWSVEPDASVWPVLNHENGTPASPGVLQVVSAPAPNQIANIEGNLLAAGTVIFSRGITIAEPTISGTLTATYISGLGAAGVPITTAGSLGSAPLVIEITSAEN